MTQYAKLGRYGAAHALLKGVATSVSAPPFSKKSASGCCRLMSPSAIRKPRMSQNLTWIRRIVVGGILAVQAGLFVPSTPAGQINSTPRPTASGRGLGLVNIAAIVTVTPNNDDTPGALPDNNTLVALKRFNSTGYIDIPFTVTATAGVTKYQVSEFVDNNTGSNWKAFNMLLGFGTGAGFTQVGGVGDGLDFDMGPPGENNTPPTSAALPTVTRPNEDTLMFSGGTQGSGAQQYQFRIDVSNLLGSNGTFTLRQQPVVLPGDYNVNGVVDAADYVVWRNGLGTTFAQNDYNVWRANFGQMALSGADVGANAAVPEPATFVPLMFAAAVWCVRRRLTA
jgi:hypothetical protein